MKNNENFEISYQISHYEKNIQFQKQPKLGGDEIIKPFESKLIQDIKIKYASFKQENGRRQNNFEVS